jgi:polysaccharide deacetylase family protein (PEP-CTERM system associated)
MKSDMPAALPCETPLGSGTFSRPGSVVEQAALGPQILPAAAPAEKGVVRVVLSFDVEEHHQIEAAAKLTVPPALQAYYKGRVDVATRWVLEALAEKGICATFFVVGEIARDQPALIRAISQAGHELASHSWDHRRIHQHTPASFREDVRRSKETIEGITGQAVVGYRAPTFSLMRETAWAIDVLAELGMAYDSSVYPVYHDRYGVPGAPRAPFVAQGSRVSLLEIPPATLRLLGMNIPTGGGGYFRLLPTYLVRKTLEQAGRCCQPPVAMLYFHPWEFDPEQVRLPLGFLSSFRTYVGIRRTRGRLSGLLGRYRFERACDVAKRLNSRLADLPMYCLRGEATT